MVRIARPSDPKRIAELKQKVRDRSYMTAAIARLAQKLTEELVHTRNDTPR